jgi:CrcB protein
LGLLPGLGTALPAGAGALLGTGFCGALTTWSTFAYQSVDLVHRRRGRDALLNVSLTLAGGFAAVWLGTAVA